MDDSEKLAALNALADKHRAELGVGYGIGLMFGPFTLIGLHRYNRLTNDSTKGNGAKALSELCALADELGVTLTLGTTRMPLVPYFERLGFVRKESHIKYAVIMERPWHAVPVSREREAEMRRELREAKCTSC